MKKYSYIHIFISSYILLLLFKIVEIVHNQLFRSSAPEVFLGKWVLEMCSKFTGEHPCRSAISIKLQSNFLKPHFGMGVLL